MSQCSGLNSQVDVQVIVTAKPSNDVDKLEYQKPAYVALALVVAMTTISIFFPLLVTSSALGMRTLVFEPLKQSPCVDSCRITLVESIPQNLTYPSSAHLHPSTYWAWKRLIQRATSSISIASFYWSLRGSDIYKDPSDWQGEDIYKSLLHAGVSRKLRIRIVQNIPKPTQPYRDTELLQKLGAAVVRSINFTRLIGAGVLHTKLWLADGRNFYVGSANMDWRSLTQIKEVGVLVEDCPCLVEDLYKIFDVYWKLGTNTSSVPPKWPSYLSTSFNIQHPNTVHFNNSVSNTYFSSSPPPFCPIGRSTDIDAILSVMKQAQRYIHISVMDYSPTTLYTNPRRFWPVIDDTLRRASLERGVQVRLLISSWNHTQQDQIFYLRSISAINNAMKADVQVRLFKVPAFTKSQAEIPFARVNHNKYMVTDRTAYIGTSNWSGDYFISTGGIGFIITPSNRSDSNTIRDQLADVFMRDWNSKYASPV